MTRRSSIFTLRVCLNPEMLKLLESSCDEVIEFYDRVVTQLRTAAKKLSTSSPPP